MTRRGRPREQLQNLHELRGQVRVGVSVIVDMSELQSWTEPNVEPEEPTMNNFGTDAREVLDALRDSQAALRKVARECTKMADAVAGLQRLLRYDHNLGLFEEPPPADNDHVAEGASLFPEGTAP